MLNNVADNFILFGELLILCQGNINGENDVNFIR